MPSPTFTFRLPAKDKAAMAEMAKIYGAPSPGAFCAEMIGAMCANDMVRVQQFIERLITKIGEQLNLDFKTTLELPLALHKSIKPLKKVKATSKGRKRA